ncbi:RUS family member 1 [Ornithorhynchus anatinus]|uniref:RUS family member 1 n=1 Tax=Ornithorhynchus anatinus TaxID=9258 RepID=F7BIE3_ORNAN|nr:RUS family member 1 [Ornithorhynchus anatinus]
MATPRPRPKPKPKPKGPPRAEEMAVAWERHGPGPRRPCAADAHGRLRWDPPAAPAPALALALPQLLTSVFLPRGFPDSVSPDYLSYQLWDTVQAFASSLTGSLATQAVLRGVGVGDGTASVSAATVTWLLKDGTGMLGRIGFAWKKGSKLDCDAKKWRLFADVLNDAAMFLEIVAPAFPAYFTLTVCVSSLAKCIVGVAGGATRAALTVHQARRNNMADVSAKDGSQETLVNLAGLLVSLMLLPLVSDRPSLCLPLFLLFTSLHLYANFRAVRAVVMETLNEARLRLVLEHFLREGQVLSLASANEKEPLWTDVGPALTLALGVPLHSLVSDVSDLQLMKAGHQQAYLLHWDRARGHVQVALAQTAGPRAILRAATHGLLLGFLLEEEPLSGESEALRKRVKAAPEMESWAIIEQTHHVLDALFPDFLRGLQAAGWETERHLLEVDEWRAGWSRDDKKSL